MCGQERGGDLDGIPGAEVVNEEQRFRSCEYLFAGLDDLVVTGGVLEKRTPERVADLHRDRPVP